MKCIFKRTVEACSVWVSGKRSLFSTRQMTTLPSVCLSGVWERGTRHLSHSRCTLDAFILAGPLLVGRLIAVLAALRKTGSRCNQYDHLASVGDSRAQRRAIHQRSSRPRVHLDHTALHILQRMCINKKVVLISCSSSEVYSILFPP